MGKTSNSTSGVGISLTPEEKKKSRSKSERSKNIFLIAVLAYPLLNFFVFYVLVNANSIALAFQSIDKNYNYSFAGLANFEAVIKEIATDGALILSMKNSIIVFIVTLVIGMPLNMIFSYFLFIKVQGHGGLRIAIMIPSIISGLMMAMLFTKFVENALPSIMMSITKTNDFPNLLQNLDYALNTLIVYQLLTGFSSSLIIYCNAMNGVGDNVVEAAMIDGCTHVQMLWHILVPLIYPTISTYLVTGIAGLFASQGPLYIFYDYNAPRELYFTGYYLFVKVMKGTLRDYPFASAAGLLLTFLSVPLTLITKSLLEKYDYTRDI